MGDKAHHYQMVSLTVRCHLDGAMLKYIQIHKHGRRMCSLVLHIPFVLGTPLRVVRTVLVECTKYRCCGGSVYGVPADKVARFYTRYIHSSTPIHIEVRGILILVTEPTTTLLHLLLPLLLPLLLVLIILLLIYYTYYYCRS